MKKHVAVIAALIGIFTVMGGCKKDPAKEQAAATNQAAGQANDQVKEDLAGYSSSVAKITKPLETLGKLTEDLAKAKTANAYASKLRKEFVPLVTGVVTQMETLKPATKEVLDIHNAYLASIKDLAAGFNEMAAAVEKNDDKLVSAAEAKINSFKTADAKFMQEYLALAKKYNITIK